MSEPAATVPVDLIRVQRRSVAALSASQVLSGLAVAGAVPAGSLVAVAVTGSEAYAGLAQTAGVVGAAVLALPLARIALGRGRRMSLATGYAIGALGALTVVAGSSLRSIWVVLIGCLLTGVASASGYQARYAATDLAPAQRRARDLSIVVWAGTVGAVLGPNLLPAAAALGERLGLLPVSGAYVLTAVWLGLTVLLLLVLLRPDPYLVARQAAAQRDAHVRAEIARPRLSDGIRHLRGRPAAMLGIAAISIGHVAMVMVMVMTPIHMKHVDVSLQVIGLVISVHVAGMYALSPAVGWAADRWGRIPVILAGVGILVLSCVLSGFTQGSDVGLLGVGLFLLGLGWSCTLIAGSALVTDATDEAERPSVQGLSDLAMNSSAALGGIVAGVVVATSSYAVLCAVAAVPVLGLGALTVVARRRRVA